MNNGDMPAFGANELLISKARNVEDVELSLDTSVLTKREHFAGLAMQSLCKSTFSADMAHYAERSVFMADLLLKELDK